MISTMLIMLGFLLCLIGSVWNPPRVNLTSLGLACWLLSILLGAAHL